MTVKKFFVVVGCVFITIALYLFFLWVTYVDNTVTTGEAYGFKVGDTKIDTYCKAREIYKRKKVYILYPIGGDMFGPHYEFNFSSEEYPKISDRVSWEIYMDEGFFNSIILKFSDERLIEIYRHRQYFELP